MNFSINKFFEKDECNSIIEFSITNGVPFSYNPKEVWDCRRIYNDEFKEKIINRLTELYNKNEFKLWFDLDTFNVKDINISLTQYYDGRWLNLHLDSTSQFTTVIVLSEDFIDGRFALTNSSNILINDCEKFDLNIGESISFDGSKTYHGVLPVTNGIRYALNIWMTDTDVKYKLLKNNKTII